MKAGTGNQVRGDGRLETAIAISGQLGGRGGRMLRNTFRRPNSRRFLTLCDRFGSTITRSHSWYSMPMMHLVLQLCQPRRQVGQQCAVMGLAIEQQLECSLNGRIDRSRL